MMTREEFCKYHWDYYIVLEKDFIDTERYLSFDLGDNNFYNTGNSFTDSANSFAFSVEYIKQYQAICSEVDVIMKSMCAELGDMSSENMPQYTSTILSETCWRNIINQKVTMRGIELQPFKGWSDNPYKSFEWWSPYNGVKHKRLENLREANLKNVSNALAGLFILGNYFVKKIAEKVGNIDAIDVPNNKSALFEMMNWQTNWTILGKDKYFAPSHQIRRMFEENN